MFNSDIDALVKETLNFNVDKNVNKNQLGALDDFIFNQGQSVNTPIAPTNQVPGVLYHLEKKVSTFVIRIIPSQNLALDYKLVLDRPEDYPTLRLVTDDDKPINIKLEYFECDSIFLARKIQKELGNKRFPFFEEHVLNISDPTDSWWVNLEMSQLKIFFNLSRTESIDQLVKIGPLGDADEAIDMFNKLYGYFQMLFPIEDYASAHGQLSIKCAREFDPIFRAFIQIFLTGDADHGFWEFLRDLEMKSQHKPFLESLKKANLFLMEIATKRRFWKKIQDALED